MTALSQSHDLGEGLSAQRNSIAVSKGTLDDRIKCNSETNESDLSYANGVDTETGFLE